MLPMLDKFRPGKRNSMKLNPMAKSWSGRSSATSSSSSSSALVTQLDLQTFPQFKQLNEDLRKHIISFVTEAPLAETIPNSEPPWFRPGSLTTSLPLVSKEFYRWSNRDEYWEPALRRRVNDKTCGLMWQDGLRRLLPLGFEMPTTEGSNNSNKPDMIRIVQSHLHGRRQQDLSFKDLYKKVATTHVQFDAPIFIMPCQLQLGEVYGLHLFEPRYRIMMRDLMQGCLNPQQSSSGGRIIPGTRDGMITPPMLLHLHRGNRLAPGETAMLVQVVFCRMYEHGNADVRLLPVCEVRMSRIWVRPNAGHLFCARVSRLPSGLVRSVSS